MKKIGHRGESMGFITGSSTETTDVGDMTSDGHVHKSDGFIVWSLAMKLVITWLVIR